MVRTWQFYALVFLFLGSAQSGLLVIANAAPMLNQTAGSLPFFAANAWLLASFGGLVNAAHLIHMHGAAALGAPVTLDGVGLFAALLALRAELIVI